MYKYNQGQKHDTKKRKRETFLLSVSFYKWWGTANEHRAFLLLLSIESYVTLEPATRLEKMFWVGKIELLCMRSWLRASGLDKLDEAYNIWTPRNQVNLGWINSFYHYWYLLEVVRKITAKK